MKDDAPQALLPPIVVELLLQAVGAIFNARQAPAGSPNGGEPKPEPEERLLTAQQVAERLNVKLDWVYRHGKRLPFAVNLGDRFLRFSESGLNRYIRKREGRAW